MSTIAHALVSALYMAFAMGWEILWPLILGFALSGIVQAVVPQGGRFRRGDGLPVRLDQSGFRTLAVLIGWQFVAAAFVGGLIMVALLT